MALRDEVPHVAADILLGFLRFARLHPANLYFRYFANLHLVNVDLANFHSASPYFSKPHFPNPDFAGIDACAFSP